MRNNSEARRNSATKAPPPPYETAVYRRLWAVVAPYIDPSDLYAACLTCRQWHQVFIPYLWGNPATRFGTDNDTVYLSITRFKRLLPYVRPDVRRLTHSLQLPPAQPEFYGGPQAGWLRNILDYLPCLQALIVSSLSFFDHQALQAANTSSRFHPHLSKYNLRLLIASNCENTTAGSLATSLSYFPDLMYLDLSSTQGSRNPLVLGEIGVLTQLTVLKMQNCGLRDGDINLLKFSRRLRSLDVRDNYLTGKGVSDLIGRLPAVRQRVHYPGRAIAGPLFEGHTLQSLAATKLMSGLDGHIFLEDHLPTSFTELFLSGNFVTLDELTEMLTYPSLQYLDAGSMYCSRQPSELLSPISPVSEHQRFSNSRVDELSPAFFTRAFRNVQSLRLHHSVVTSQPFYGKSLPVAEQCFELHDEDLRFELDSTEIVPRFELDDTSVSFVTLSLHSQNEDTTSYPESTTNSLASGYPTFETPDDVGVGLSPSASIKARNSTKDLRDDQHEGTPSKRNIPPNILLSHSNHAQPFREHVNNDHAIAINHQYPPRYAPPGSSTEHKSQARQSPYTANKEKPGPETERNGDGTSSIKRTIEDITQRRQRTIARERYPGRFQPSMLPNLEVLTLTDVPSTSRRQDLINSLTTFIQECAEEEELATLECLELHERNDHYARKHSTTKILKLKRLVLEMSPTPDPVNPPHSPHSPREKRHSFTKSSTEDPDSEMFMEATETDFSFFREDDGGLLISEGKIDTPTMVDNGMIYMGSPTANGHPLDVIQEVATFRREKRMGYQAAVQMGKSKLDTTLLGNWRGEIKVVKNFLSL